MAFLPVAQGLGRAGNEWSQATDSNLDRALKLIQSKLMIQEIQQRLKQSQQKQPQGMVGNMGVTFDPQKGYEASVIPGLPATGATPPKNLEQAWLEAFPREHEGRQPSTKDIEAHYKVEREKDMDRLISQGIDMAMSGNPEGAKVLFGVAQQAAGAKKGGGGQPSLMNLIMQANAGNPEAAKAVKAKLDYDKEVAKARGIYFGQGRAMYQINAYADPDSGQVIPMSNFDAIEAIRNGKSLIPTGRLPANMVLSVQQLVSEATPAIKSVRDNLGAYDNATDRAIFARILANNPAATVGQETTWLSNVLNQAATSGLSPQGRALVVRLNRLNESVGRLRGVLGLPATERMVAMTLALVPGPSTPDSAFAKDMMDNLEQTVTNAVGIPMLKGLAEPPKGGKVREIDLTK